MEFSRVTPSLFVPITQLLTGPRHFRLRYGSKTIGCRVRIRAFQANAGARWFDKNVMRITDFNVLSSGCADHGYRVDASPLPIRRPPRRN
jgi:hypothetical protein